MVTEWNAVSRYLLVLFVTLSIWPLTCPRRPVREVLQRRRDSRRCSQRCDQFDLEGVRFLRSSVIRS
jgi:hypothetical protein